MAQKQANIFALPKLNIGPWDATGTNFVGLPVETTPAAFVIPIKDTTRFKADPAYQAVTAKGAIDNWTQLRNISIGWRRTGAPAAASDLGPGPFVIDDLMLLTKYPAFSVAGSNVPVNLSFDEGPSANTGTFTLGVTALPSHDVTITVGAPDPNKLEVSSDGTNFGPAAQVIYSTANYTTPATITVRAKEGAFEGADYECDLVLSRATSDLWYGSVDKAPIANVHVAVNAAPPPPPESSILAPADTTIAGQSMSLWVKTPGSATFVPTGLEQPGASGTFVYTAPADSDDNDGVYYFASTTTDTLGISEPDPVTEDVALIVNTDANSPYMCTVAAGDTETTYPMTSAQDVVIRITGATNPGQITVERTPSITPPAHFKVPDQVVKESLTITSKGLGTFSATLDWQFDLALAAGVSPIDSAFAFETDGQPTVYGATRSGDTVTISGVTAFSTWYLGNPESVPVALSAFTLE